MLAALAILMAFPARRTGDVRRPQRKRDPEGKGLRGNTADGNPGPAGRRRIYRVRGARHGCQPGLRYIHAASAEATNQSIAADHTISLAKCAPWAIRAIPIRVP